MKAFLRRWAAQALDFPGVANVLAPDRKRLGIIFVMHRFEDSELGIEGMPAAALRELLAGLRRKKIRLVSLTDLLETAERPERPRGPWVAFTLDDGYEDQIRIGLSIFREFDAPATLFPITGFVDGRLWPWWNQVDYVAGEAASTSNLVEKLKLQSAEARNEALAELAAGTAGELPSHPPITSMPASWDDLRRWEAAGLHVGCHTDSHPILAREPEGVLEDELRGSWDRLSSELSDPKPILALPNGRWGIDYGEREAKLARELGFSYGLSGEGGYLLGGPSPTSGEAGGWHPFRLPRFFLGPDIPHTARILSGLAPVPKRTLGVGSQDIEGDRS